MLVNVSVALAAMGVGAFGLPLDLSNLLGGMMVLVFCLFSRFLLNGSRIPKGQTGAGSACDVPPPRSIDRPTPHPSSLSHVRPSIYMHDLLYLVLWLCSQILT